MWDELGTLWLDHLSYIHRKDDQRPISEETVHHMKTHVRLLHQLQPHTLPVHQEQYFQPDPEEFVAKAHPATIRKYLATYKPHIVASIKRAADTIARLSTTSVSRLMIPQTLTFSRSMTAPTMSTSPASPRIPAVTHHALEEASHWKRNRLRLYRRTTPILLSPTPFP